MSSEQRRRPPRNIYTEKRAEREFHSFIQHSRLNNVPIPDNLIPPSELPQAGTDNRPSAAKRQRLTPPEVCQTFLYSGHFYLI